MFSKPILEALYSLVSPFSLLVFQFTLDYKALLYKRKNLSGTSVKVFFFFYLSIYFYQTPIEKLQNHQEALKDEVMTLKSKLKAVLDHTTQLEAMMKALMKHHGISVEEEEEGEDDD